MSLARMTMLAIAGAVAALVLAACHTGANSAPSRAEPVGAYYPTVPAVAPDSFPHALFAALGLIRSPDGHSVPMIRSIAAVTFRDEATQPEKQAVVDAMGGVVVGGEGASISSTYYVRIRGGAVEDIIKALRTAGTFSQVDFAAPLMKNAISGYTRDSSTRIDYGA